MRSSPILRHGLDAEVARRRPVVATLALLLAVGGGAMLAGCGGKTEPPARPIAAQPTAKPKPETKREAPPTEIAPAVVRDPPERTVTDLSCDEQTVTACVAGGGMACRKVAAAACAAPAAVETATGEGYAEVDENPFKPVAHDPLSTFSIDVDTASYSNFRRFINQGQLPPKDAVRIEEMLNYFPYADRGPRDGKPFAVGLEVGPCPWAPTHQLARIALKGVEVGQAARPAANLVFLLDVSGSMDEPNKLPWVKQSLRLLVDQLRADDHVAIAVYAGASGLALPPTPGSERERILAAIDSLQPGGGTNGEQGIALAYQQATAGFAKGGINRVILCTDGDFNIGVSDAKSLGDLITGEAKSGVFLSVLGFGMGNVKDDTMESLADKGNGNYAYIDSRDEARKVLVEQMTGTLLTIAKDVKIQVEFNPVRVAGYRLIGYENRMLAARDFNDDQKDAGEIGAGIGVTALYELVPVGEAIPDQGDVDALKYQAPAQPRMETGYELMTVKLRWKKPGADISELLAVPVRDGAPDLEATSDDFHFSAAVAEAGMLLRASPHKGAADWKQVSSLASEGLGADPHGYRAEFIALAAKAATLAAKTSMVERPAR